MSEISFNLGLMIGPLLAGVITENIDFSAMSMTLGKTNDYILPRSSSSYISTLGTLCLVVALLTYNFFMSGHQPADDDDIAA